MYILSRWMGFGALSNVSHTLAQMPSMKQHLSLTRIEDSELSFFVGIADPKRNIIRIQLSLQ